MFIGMSPTIAVGCEVLILLSLMATHLMYNCLVPGGLGNDTEHFVNILNDLV